LKEVGKRCYDECETLEGFYARNVKERTDVAVSNSIPSGLGNIVSPVFKTALMLGDTPLEKVSTPEGISHPSAETPLDFGTVGTTADLPPHRRVGTNITPS